MAEAVKVKGLTRGHNVIKREKIVDLPKLIFPE